MEYQLWLWLAVVGAIIGVLSGVAFHRNNSYEGDGWFLSGVILGLIATIGFGVTFLTTTSEMASCHQKGSRLGVHTTYSAMSGCFVETRPGHLVPFDNWVENTGN